jgi:hypothetical protein
VEPRRRLAVVARVEFVGLEVAFALAENDELEDPLGLLEVL